MLLLTVEKNGVIMKLTQNESDWQLISVSGLNPPRANISTSTNALMDGSQFNSARLNNRNIVIKLRLNGDVETNRITLYNYFRPKEQTRVYLTNGQRSVFIDGYVESVEVDPFSKSEIMQISLICNNPYFSSATSYQEVLKEYVEAFEFPFSIDAQGVPFGEIVVEKDVTIVNESEYNTGLIMNVHVIDSCESIRIRKLNSSEFILLTGNYYTGDIITIDTNRGAKTIKLLRDGVVTNIFNNLNVNSTLFDLSVGENVIDYQVNGGALDRAVEIYFNYRLNYGGI